MTEEDSQPTSLIRDFKFERLLNQGIPQLPIDFPNICPSLTSLRIKIKQDVVLFSAVTYVQSRAF